METEAHVYALAIAASVLLSFYPLSHRDAFVLPQRPALAGGGGGHLRGAGAIISRAIWAFFVRRNSPRSSVEIGSNVLLFSPPMAYLSPWKSRSTGPGASRATAPIGATNWWRWA